MLGSGVLGDAVLLSHFNAENRIINVNSFVLFCFEVLKLIR